MNAQRLLQHFNRIAEAPDAVPRLRRFILDLAVRGKLVEQDPKDEPTSELLKRIQTEKVRLVKEGRIRNPRALGVNEEDGELFRIPVAWTWCRLSEVGAIVGGGTPPSVDSENFAPGGSGIAWLTPADLGKRTDLYVSHGARDLTPQGLRSSSATLMPKGSILFTSRAPIGYTAIAANKVSTNQGFKSVVPFIPECNFYIAVYFRAFAKWIDDQASGTTFREVSGKIVANLPFPLPPLAEQQRIVTKVDELMALCDRLRAAQAERESRRDRLVAASLRRLNNGVDADAFRAHARFHLHHLPRLTIRHEHVQQLRQTILNLAVRGKLVPQDSNDEPASELLRRIEAEKARLVKEGKLKSKPQPPAIDEGQSPFRLPTNWRLVRFGELITDSDAGWSPKSEGFPRSGDNWGVLKVSAVSWDKFLPEENKQLMRGVTPPEAAQVHAGDFLISRANTSELVAKCVLVEEEPRNLILSDKIIRLRIPEKCSKKFLCMVNNHAAHARSYYAEEASGTSLSMKNVSRPVIYALAIPFLPLAEQHRILAKVDELMALCERLEAQLTTAQTDSRRLLEAVLAEAISPEAEIQRRRESAEA